MKVLLADSNHPVLHESLQDAGFICELCFEKSAEEIKSMLPGFEILVIRSKFRLDRDILEQCPRLTCIARVGAGMENIDLDFARSRGILCLSVPEGNRDAVGEHALGMLLMLLNHLKRADSEVRNGIWKRIENRGTEIMGKTVGIIGYGNTGSSFARKLSGFECRILAHDKYKIQLGNSYVEEVKLDAIFNLCDIVSLHLPLTPETRYFADKGFFESFRKPVYFLNTSRGPCVNTAHLVEALKCGKVSGACLDVLEYESSSFEGTEIRDANFNYLIQSENVILSPHIAGWTHESNYKMSKGIAEKIIAAFPSVQRVGI
ncbi:MAG TPA: NAD(P)-dependent oxidoreductase [Bacteroidia bacterium]|nr:NAD(P)-dependent oxidoreductase [Bacteroidia bacterium]